MRHGPASIALVLFSLLASALLAPALARAEQVDVELALGVDISRSVTPEEGQLQRRGYVAGFTHPQVLDAIKSGRYGKIAVTYFEWSGSDDQRILVPWTLIDGPAAAQKFADALQAAPIDEGFRTSISGAIDFSKTLYGKAGYAGDVKALDISGDGRNNDGRPSSLARDEAVAAGIVINGLPIINTHPRFAGYGYGGGLDLHVDQAYNDEVIGGPRSFMIVVQDFNSFAEALVRKLVFEISGATPKRRGMLAGERWPTLPAGIRPAAVIAGK